MNRREFLGGTAAASTAASVPITYDMLFSRKEPHVWVRRAYVDGSTSYYAEDEDGRVVGGTWIHYGPPVPWINQ